MIIMMMMIVDHGHDHVVITVMTMTMMLIMTMCLKVVRRVDNLRPEGDFQRREEGRLVIIMVRQARMVMVIKITMKVIQHHLMTTRVWEAGEKVESCKKRDNLKVEGGFDFA